MYATLQPPPHRLVCWARLLALPTFSDPPLTTLPPCPLANLSPSLSSAKHLFEQMRTSRLLLALGAIQLLIMLTCVALPSIGTSIPKRVQSFTVRPKISAAPSQPPFVWRIDEAVAAVHASMPVKTKPYDLWLMPPAPPLRHVQQQQQQQQQQQEQQRASLRASGGEIGEAHSNASPPPPPRKQNPNYAMKFNQEALKQQQQGQQGQQSDSGGQMFQSRSTNCSGSVNFRLVTAAAAQHHTGTRRRILPCSIRCVLRLFHAFSRDITAVTHMSVDRRQRLVDLERNWAGPIVVAVYTRSPEGA